MGYVALASRPDVQVFSPTLVLDTVRVTFQTTPSGVIGDYQIPKLDFDEDLGAGLLTGLADAIEVLMGLPGPVGGAGVQLVDDTNNLLYDAIDFTISYTPPGVGRLPLTASAVIPVDIITADPGFSQFLTGGSANDRIAAVYAQLQAIAGG